MPDVSAGERVSASPALVRRRVLFVDDEPAVLAGLRDALRPVRHLWDLLFVGSAEAALRELAVGPFDVLVTDMRMPGINGATLLLLAQQRFPRTIRLVLTGHTELEAALRGGTTASEVLMKPCPPGTIIEALERAGRLLDELETEDRAACQRST